MKEVGEAIVNEAKKQKGGFVILLLGTLLASLLKNLLTGNGVKEPKASNQTRANIPGWGVVRSGQDTNSPSQDF